MLWGPTHQIKFLLLLHLNSSRTLGFDVNGNLKMAPLMSSDVSRCICTACCLQTYHASTHTTLHTHTSTRGEDKVKRFVFVEYCSRHLVNIIAFASSNYSMRQTWSSILSLRRQSSGWPWHVLKATQLVTGRLTSSEFTKPHPRARVLLSQEESKKVAAYIRRETRRTFSVS